MIEVRWTVSLKCDGGRFVVPDGTPATEISKKVSEQVERSTHSLWSPHYCPAKGTDQV